MAKIALLVDSLEGSKVPSTSDIEQILFNFETIEKHCGINLKDKLDEQGMLAEIFPVFHFICAVTMYTKEIGTITFIDGSMDEKAAYSWFKNLTNNGDKVTGELFMKAYYAIQENYESLFGRAELIFGGE